ncbi:MAG: thermonuclease family protein [Candidatus Sumerlaeaceae bacterium]|nr:thermonuclease family protein [Candidatus Sumerlaeaceae bacterium]
MHYFFAAVVAVTVSIDTSAQGQKVAYSPRGETTANRSDYSVSYSTIPRRPRSYDYYYNNREYAGQTQRVAARVTPVPQPVRRVIGAVKPYSESEYANLVMKNARETSGEVEESQEAQSAGTTASAETVLTRAIAKPTTTTIDGVFEAVVEEVTPEGLLVTKAGDLRLRGLSFPSAGAANEMEKAWGEKIVGQLRALLAGRKIFYTVDAPAQDENKRALIIAHFADGTELNRMLIESGFASVQSGQFADVSAYRPLYDAQDMARAARRGIWEQ